jgi:hypothetical protein
VQWTVGHHHQALGLARPNALAHGGRQKDVGNQLGRLQRQRACRVAWPQAQARGSPEVRGGDAAQVMIDQRPGVRLAQRRLLSAAGRRRRLGRLFLLGAGAIAEHRRPRRRDGQAARQVGRQRQLEGLRREVLSSHDQQMAGFAADVIDEQQRPGGEQPVARRWPESLHGSRGGQVAIQRRGVEDLTPGGGVLLPRLLQLGQQLLPSHRIAGVGPQSGPRLQAIEPAAGSFLLPPQLLAARPTQVGTRIEVRQSELIHQCPRPPLGRCRQRSLDVAGPQATGHQPFVTGPELSEVAGSLVGGPVGPHAGCLDHVNRLAQQRSLIGRAPLLTGDPRQSPQRQVVCHRQGLLLALLQVGRPPVQRLGLLPAALPLHGQAQVVESARQQWCSPLLLLHCPQRLPRLLDRSRRRPPVPATRQLVQRLAVQSDLQERARLQSVFAAHREEAPGALVSLGQPALSRPQDDLGRVEGRQVPLSGLPARAA